MKPQVVRKVHELILHHDDPADLRILAEACFNRARALERVDAAALAKTVKKGTMVEIVGNIKPKYLKGAQAKCVRKEKDRCFMVIPQFGYRRYSGVEVGIPWTCIEKVA